MKAKVKCISASFFISWLSGLALSVNDGLLMEAREGKTIYEKQDELEQTVFCCPVVELRQYTLPPGKRDILNDLFDREFIESQEAVGMTIIGQFRDLDNPN